MDRLTLAISQGSLRRGSAAVYLPVCHPEIEEFIEIRRPTGGDPNRKALNLHHGILISDAFMRAVEADEEWALRRPKDGAVVRKISARALWIRILTARIETGEPYLIFSDHVNNARPEHHKLAGLEVKTSNLCSEITLPTGVDQHGKQRTAVCCLSSLNLETWFEWKDHPTFIEDVMRFLDNVLQDFIDSAPAAMAQAQLRRDARALGRPRRDGLPLLPAGAERAVRERDRQGVEQEDVQAHPRPGATRRRRMLAEERGACPDAAEYGIDGALLAQDGDRADRVDLDHLRRRLARASSRSRPTSSLHKTLSGSFIVRNRAPAEAAGRRRAWTTRRSGPRSPSTKGSVQHLDFLTEQEKAVFKTAFELDQRWVVEHAADRAPFICQSQSVNLFLPAERAQARPAPDPHAWPGSAA